MDSVEFEIFIPDGKKFHLTPDTIVFGLWILAIGFLWPFDTYFPGHAEVRETVAICVGIISMYYIAASFFTYKSLNGTLAGEIEFENDRIVINNKTYELKNISNLDFGFNDYYGQNKPRTYKSANPVLSQGVNNYVTFTDASGETQTVYFKLATEHHYQELSPFINEAIKAKKMDFKRGIDLMGIENISINT